MNLVRFTFMLALIFLLSGCSLEVLQTEEGLWLYAVGAGLISLILCGWYANRTRAGHLYDWDHQRGKEPDSKNIFWVTLALAAVVILLTIIFMFWVGGIDSKTLLKTSGAICVAAFCCAFLGRIFGIKFANEKFLASQGDR
jgi:hypothetical protein